MILNEDWEFNVIGIYNYKKPGQLDKYYEYITENHDHIKGDICEAGVYKGRSLLATALLLKELGSSKKVYGFDSFEGFPPLEHENDKIEKFEELLVKGIISKEHFSKVKKNIQLRSLSVKGSMSSRNISLSGNFSDTNGKLILEKADFLGLDNIKIVPGFFSETMTGELYGPENIMAAMLDCDLYMSYKVTLPFVWPRMTLGGYIWLDEYYSLKFPGARIACDEFFGKKPDKPQRHKMNNRDFERWYVRKLHNYT
jgi:hypothetical protein